MSVKTRDSSLRVLAIGAHPDDAELFCAGTLARCAERGDAVSIAIVCKGDSASLDLPPETLAATRSREARSAAAVIGADLIEMGLSDYEVDVTPANKRLFADAIRRARPDVVLTHFHTDYGSDHNNTFILVRDSVLAATIPQIRTDHAPIEAQPAVFMWEPLGGYGFQPDYYVNVTGSIDKKLTMLEQHRSQREWLQRHGGIDFAEYVQVMARFRGYQCGVPMAEGFVALQNWGSPRTGALLP